MGLKRTDKFRQDAVRIALNSGLTRKQVADDLGVGMSTLNKWITAHRDTDVVSKGDLSLAQENDRLRRESRILKEERDILEKNDTAIACLAISNAEPSHSGMICKNCQWRPTWLFLRKATVFFAGQKP
jgi:transposase